VAPAPAAPAGVGAARARRVELADIVRAHGAAYDHAHRLCRAQRRALRAIAACRTAVLGGHRAVCMACGAERITYNSCRNRHCPKCQRVATERWLAARRREVLPIPYFHVVFTLPHALNPLAQSHPRLLYRWLFHAAASTLTRFGRDPRHLGGELGVTAVLHTWGQTLTQHVHVHCVVTGGALAPDGTRWIPARPGFLFPVRAVAKVFRGRFLAGLQRAFDGGEVHVTGGRVRFRWRDYADGDRVKVMDLDVDEFLRRFLLHVVPDGFVRIRHFGLLANRRRAAALAQCRTLLAQPAPPPVPSESARALMLRLTGIDLERCPVCGQGRVCRVEILPPTGARRPRFLPAVNTS
jgi:hypothetical protein